MRIRCARDDQLLAELLRQQGLPVKQACGGLGRCQSCRVRLDGEWVRSCQTRVAAGDYEILLPAGRGDERIAVDCAPQIPPVGRPRARWRRCIDPLPAGKDWATRLAAAGPWERVAASALSGWQRLPAAGDPALVRDGALIRVAEQGSAVGLAIDCGSTTLAGALIDLTDGRCLAQTGRLNGQYGLAEDVVGRQRLAADPGGRRELCGLLRASLQALIDELLTAVDGRCELVEELVCCGNPTIVHLLLNQDPSGMGRTPFVPVELAPAARPATALGLRLPAPAVILPAPAAYLGGDIVAGLLAVAPAADGPQLLADLGTNCELVLRWGDRSWGTAVPAGPAFEGAALRCGLGAVPGAIHAVSRAADDRLVPETLGGGAPVGWCGSGVLAWLARAQTIGLVDQRGRLAAAAAQVVELELDGRRHRVWQAAVDVHLSEADIAQVLQAKAAVQAGIAGLCRAAGVDWRALQLVLAGSLARHLHVDDLIRLGILPPLSAARIESCGNTALAGACRWLLDADCPDLAARSCRELQWVELNQQPAFMDDYIEACSLPADCAGEHRAWHGVGSTARR